MCEKVGNSLFEVVFLPRQKSGRNPQAMKLGIIDIGNLKRIKWWPDSPSISRRFHFVRGFKDSII